MGKAQLEQDTPGYAAFDWSRQAMECYEKAETLSPAANDDAVLRWNTCVRLLKRNVHVRPRPEDHTVEANFNDDVVV